MTDEITTPSTVQLAAIPSITIFVRHKPSCKHADAGDETYKFCRCPKHLRWSDRTGQHRKSAKTRTWSIAEGERFKIEATYRNADPSKPLPTVVVKAEARPTIDRAIELYISDKLTQGLDHTAHKKHARELGRFSEFMAQRGKHFPHEIVLSDLTEFRAGWVNLYGSSVTRAKVQERLRGFLRYCFNSKMIDQIPQLSPIKIVEPPTLPLTERQYAKLLEVLEVEFRNPERVKRMHALVRLMRYSGLAIMDAVTIRRAELVWDTHAKMHSVVTSRQKTGTHVSVPLPPDVAAEIIAVMELNGHPDYIFWNRIEGKPKAAVDVWERAFRRAFKAAGMPDGHSHQLRDTFAVELLKHGVPIEEVSKLLGHTSIRTTEKSYAPWVQARQQRLNSLVVATWTTTPTPTTTPTKKGGKILKMA
jgi:integrase